MKLVHVTAHRIHRPLKAAPPHRQRQCTRWSIPTGRFAWGTLGRVPANRAPTQAPPHGLMRGWVLLIVMQLVALRLASESPAPPTDAGGSMRLGIIDLQAGSRGAPQRVTFAVPPSQGVQAPLFDVLLGRALLGVCVDRTTRSRAGLTTRPLRRNATVGLSTEGHAETWQALLQVAKERSAEAQAHLLLLFLRGKNLSGIGFVHPDDLDEVNEHFIGGAVVVSGHKFITDMYEAAQKRRASGKQCMVRRCRRGSTALRLVA
eukprot:7378043-Prymnesium_polylepis.2